MRVSAQRFQAAMSQLAHWSAVALMFGVMVSKPLFNLASASMLIGWILAGGFRSRWAVLRANPLTLPSLALCALVAAGTLYSPASAEYIGRHFYVYSRVLLMLLLVTLFADAEWRRRGLAAFAAGALLTLASTYASVWFQLPWSASQATGLGHSHHVFMDYIAQGVAMSFFAALSIAYAMRTDKRPLQAIWIVTAILAAFSVTHLLQSRTAQLVLLAMLAVVMLTLAPARWRWPLLALLAVLPAIAYLSSPLLQERFLKGVAEAQQYLDHGTNDSSIGARLDMWRNSLEMFAASPLWGHGTSSYRVLSEQIFTDPAICAVSCIHPHNQFLFFGVEFGLPGVIAYALLLLLPLRAAATASPSDRLLLRAFIAVVLVDSFINSPLWITTERHFYTALLPLLAAGLQMAPRRRPVVPAAA